MNARNLGILAGLTAVVGGLAALALYRERAAVVPKAESGLVLAGFEAKVNEVSSIEVSSGEKKVTVQRDPAKADSPWTVQELGGYPAKFEKVKGLLVGLAGLEKVEPKTDRPDSYEKIGVEDPAPGNTATLVRIAGPGGAPGSLGAVIVGKSKPAGDKPEVYIRIQGEPQSWLARGDISTSADPVQWVDTEVLKIDSTRMKSATVRQADGTTLVVARPDKQAAYAVEGVPEGRALKTASAGSPVAGALAFLSFESVKPAGEIAWDTGGEATAEFRTFDGLVVTAATVEADGKVWAKFDAAFDESAVPPATSTPPELPPKEDGSEPSEEEKAAAAKKAQDDAEAARGREIEKVKKEVETLSAKLAAWAYQVPKTKGDVLRRKMEDLLAEVPKEEPAEEDGAPVDEGNGADPDADDGVVPDGSEQPEDGDAGPGGG